MPVHCRNPGSRFPRTNRLLNSAEYQAVLGTAQWRLSHRHYLLLAKPNAGQAARLGLVVSRKNIRLATRRNRIKRVVRETFRHYAYRLRSLDVLFLSRRGLDELPPARQTRLLREAWCELDKLCTGDSRPWSTESSSA